MSSSFESQPSQSSSIVVANNPRLLHNGLLVIFSPPRGGYFFDFSFRHRNAQVVTPEIFEK